MLSDDEIKNGMTFILKLWDGNDVSTQWIETLRGPDALHWYEIYRTSEWGMLRREASQVFKNVVSEAEAERVRLLRQRCVFIHTSRVKTGELEGSQPTSYRFM